MQVFMALVGIIIVVLMALFMISVFIQVVGFFLCIPVWVYILVFMIYLFCIKD